MEAYAGGSKREWAEDAVDVDTRQRHPILEDPTARESDTMKDVVVVLANVIAAEEISMGAHLDNLVLVDLAARTRASGEILEARQENP